VKGEEANLLCKVASAIRGVQNLIVEHWEVECQPKPDGVGWCQISKSNILQTNQQQWITINKICTVILSTCTQRSNLSSFVSIHGALRSILPLRTWLELSKVPAKSLLGEIRYQNICAVGGKKNP
jgi:hypothetical protein